MGETMTAQIQDRVVFQDEDYVIAGVKGSGLFLPSDFDMDSTMISTACYRGFYMTYHCENGQLWLTEMTLRAPGGKYKPIAGVKPVIDQEWHVGRYSGLRLKTPFTGGLLLGADFIGAMYVHMGFQKPTSYRSVIELSLEDGNLRSAVDHSEQIGQMRVNNQNRLKAGRLDDIGGWISKMFSLDYDV